MIVLPGMPLPVFGISSRSHIRFCKGYRQFRFSKSGYSLINGVLRQAEAGFELCATKNILGLALTNELVKSTSHSISIQEDPRIPHYILIQRWAFRYVKVTRISLISPLSVIAEWLACCNGIMAARNIHRVKGTCNKDRRSKLYLVRSIS